MDFKIAGKTIFQNSRGLVLLAVFAFHVLARPAGELVHQCLHIPDYIFQEQGFHYGSHEGQDHMHDVHPGKSTGEDREILVTHHSQQMVYLHFEDPLLILRIPHLKTDLSPAPSSLYINIDKECPEPPPE